MFNRELAIQELVDNDINSIIRDYNEMNDASVLAYILEEGFKGYINYTDEALMKELTERDISYLFGENDDSFIQIED
mgnify:CR=1 FL=1